MLFSSLPTDLVHHILSYTGTVKMRNGTYMGQIPKTDERYELLRNISRNAVKHLGYLVKSFICQQNPLNSNNYLSFFHYNR